MLYNMLEKNSMMKLLSIILTLARMKQTEK